MATFKIPTSTKTFSQPNQGEVLGNIFRSSNIDINSNKGKIRVSPRLKTTSTGTTANDPLEAIVYGPCGTSVNSSGSAYWGIVGLKVVATTGGITPTSAWGDDPTSASPTMDPFYSDLKTWNGWMVVSAGNTIWWMDASQNAGAGLWQDLGSNRSLTSLGGSVVNKMMEVGFNKNLYVIKSGNSISYIPPSGGAVNAGSNGTLTLDPSFIITTMRSSSNRMWIGTSHLYNGEAVIIEWDLSTNSQSFNRSYKMGCTGVMSIVLDGDVPYAICSDGAIRKYNGSKFEQTAVLPVFNSGYLLNRATLGSATFKNDRAVHPNGSCLINGRINFVLNNRLAESSAFATTLENMPSGILEFYPNEPTRGIIHVYSPTLDSAGALDWGQFMISAAGAIAETKQKEAKLICGMNVYSDSATTEIKGIYVDDIFSTLTKRAFFTTPQLNSSEVDDTWKKMAVKFSKFLNSTDRIIVKYRQEKKSYYPQVNIVTWQSGSGTTAVFSTTDASFSNVVVGDEVEIIMGGSAGTSAHITAISLLSGTYTVTIDEGITATGTGKIKCQNWKKLIIQSDQLKTYLLSMLANSANWTQFKLELRGTGNSPEVEEILVNSQANQKIE